MIDKELQDYIQKRTQEIIHEKLCLMTEIINESILNEAAPRIKIRVNSRGQRSRKLKCPAGYHLVGNKCVPMDSIEKLHKKLAIRQANRTKRADATGRRKAIKKRIKAMVKRRQMGLK